jgi:hypothetical protein
MRRRTSLGRFARASFIAYALVATLTARPSEIFPDLLQGWIERALVEVGPPDQARERPRRRQEQLVRQRPRAARHRAEATPGRRRVVPLRRPKRSALVDDRCEGTAAREDRAPAAPRHACSAVHSARDVGFDSAKITGRG